MQSWNILECVEHLNRYGAFYLPAIEKPSNIQVPVPNLILQADGWGDTLPKVCCQRRS